MRKNKKHLNFLSIICLLCIAVTAMTAFSISNIEENHAFAADVSNPVLAAGAINITPYANYGYSGSASASTDSSSITFSEGNIYVQGDIAKDRTGENNGLLLAALDNNATVNIAFSGRFILNDLDQTVNLAITFEFFIGSSNIVRNTFNIALQSSNGSANYTNSIIVGNNQLKSALQGVGMTSGNIGSVTIPDMYVKVTIANNTRNTVTVSNSSFNTQVILDGDYTQDANFTIRRAQGLGANFSNVNVFNSRDAYLKGKDEIIVETTVLKSGTTSEFVPPKYYQKIFGNNNSDISWENYYYTGTEMNSSSLMTLKSTENKGRTATFAMNENIGSNVSGVAIKSNFYNMVDYSGEKMSTSQTGEIYFNVDVSRQSQPQVGENTELSLAIKNDRYYTSGLSAKLDLYYNSKLDILSKETVYALAVPRTDVDDNTFILTNLNHRDTQKVAWTDDKGVNRTADYIFPNTAGGVDYLFMVVNIDDAGNASPIWSRNVKVDANNYRFEIRAQLDNDSLQDIVSWDTIKQMFTSYILIGDAYHDQNGKYNGNTSSSAMGLVNEKVKRDQYVTIRIDVNTPQALAYLVYHITVGNKINYNRSMIEQALNSEKKYLAITFQFNKDRIDSNDTMMKVICREILQLSVTKDSFEYDRQSSAQYTANDVKVFDRKGNELKDDPQNNFRLTYAFSYKSEGDIGFSSTPKSSVGNYVYHIEVTSNNERFYGYIEGNFVIEKADPLFRNVRADGSLPYRPQEYYPTGGIYSKGLDLLKIKSDDDSGSQNISSIGVTGKFVVENPSPNSFDYFYPRAGELNVTVRFIPDSEYESSYRSETYTIKVRIDNAPVEIIYDETSFNHVYDGGEKVPKFKFIFRLPNVGEDAILELNDLYVKIEYQLLGESGYTTAKPRNAGQYNVKITVDESLTNYRGSFLPQDLSVPLNFIIEKQELKIILNDETDTYSYGLLQLLTAKSYRQSDNTLVNGIEYEYAYQYNNGEFTQYYQTLPYELMNVGNYVIRTKINHSNYKGYVDKNIKIVPVNTTTNAILINYQLPKLSVFDKYGGANIEYLQRLTDIQFDADPYFVSYDFLGRVDLAKTISGRFIFRDDPNIDYTPGPYNVDIIFEAGSYQDGNFIRNINFDDFVYPALITVAQCNIDFAQLNESGSLTLKDLVYETSLENTEFLGKVTAYGEEISGTLKIIDDLTRILSVGTHEINCSFIPNNTDNFKINANFILKIKVTEKNITIAIKDADQNNHIDKIYGQVYQDPEVTIDGKDNYGVQITYKYYQVINGREVLVEMNTTSPIGDYIIRIEPTSNNYIGTSEKYYLTIAKATLIPPSNILLPSGKYGNLLKDIVLPEMEFLNSINPNNSVTGRLTFIKYYDESQGGYIDFTPELRLNKIGVNYAVFKFVPFNNDNYEVLEFEGEFNVEKAILTRFYIENLITTYGADMLYPQARAYDNTDTVVSGLNFVYTFINKADNTPILGFPKNSGVYELTVTIDSLFYEGSSKDTYTVHKALGLVEVAETNKTIVYTGGNMDIGYLTKPENGLNVKILYKDYQGLELPREANSDKNRPINVGRYFALITIEDINYEGNLEVEFIIIPRNIEITNLEQNLANVDKLNIVSDPASLSFEIGYRENNTSNLYSVVQPTSAGEYQVKLTLRTNGLNYEITTVNGEKIVYIITKALTTITAESLYVHRYSESAPIINASVGQVGAKYKCLYRVSGSSEDFSETAPIQVGEYEVKIVVDDRNYMGETTTLLRITKADLDLAVAPYVSNTLYFTNTSDKAVFGGGDVRFSATSKPIKGTFKILTDISVKNVGDHQVEIEFIPDDQRNFNSFSNKFITVTINKLDISSVFSFEQQEYKFFYNTKEHIAKAIITDYSVLPRDYKVSEIRVKYNDSLNRPKAVGIYQLSADIEDANVTGHITNATMSIMAGEPYIIYPSLAPINKGAKLSDTSFVGKGKAYIIVDGAEKEIPGTFILNEPEKIMNFINYQDVSMRFMPNESNYAHVTFTTKIFVIGIMLSESNIKLNLNGLSIIYGDSLSALPLSGSVEKDGITIDGTFSWDDSQYIPNVNEKVGYRFTPGDQFIHEYNIYEGEVSIKVNKSELEILSVNAIGLVGQQYRNTEIDLVLRNKQNGNIVEIKKSEITIMGDSSYLSKVYASVDETVSLNIRINNPNFLELSIDNLAVNIYINTGENIFVNNTTVAYTGEAISIEELDVQLLDTEIGTSSFQYDKIYYNNQLVDKILNAGKYTVTIKLINDNNNLIYAGSKEFDIEVNKISIADEIELVSKNTFIFGENIELSFSFGRHNVLRDEYSLMYYDTKSGQTYQTPPSDAGEYRVIMTFKSLSANFIGTKEFNISVTKKTVSILLSEVSVPWRANGLSEIVKKEINPIFDGVTLGVNDYYITFDEKVEPPSNFGTFTVQVTINHKNFKGTQSARLRIEQAAVNSETAPTVSPIKYGQAVGNSKIDGGEVRASDGTIVSGKYAFKSDVIDRTDINAGTAYVTVVFSPDNANYKKLEITVLLTVQKAIASIEFTKTSKEYTGKTVYPDYIINPKGLSTSEVTINVYIDGAVASPINVGKYSVTVTINNNNYTGSATLSDYYIERAVASEIVNPKASEVSYRSSLANSSLENGAVYYTQDKILVAGEFSYVDKGLIPSDYTKTGEIYLAKVKFTPTNENYKDFVIDVPVNVVKANQELKITGRTKYTYGETVLAPTYNVPSNMIKYTNFDVMFEDMISVRAYPLRAEIVDDNYFGYLDFAIEIEHKTIEVNFVNPKNNTYVESYYTRYNTILEAKAIITDGIVYNDSAKDVEKYFKYVYFARGIENPTVYQIPPTLIGEYYCRLEFNHPSYKLKVSNFRIDYNIERAKVTSMQFDSSSLTQTYGKVSYPIVSTIPTKISYKIEFTGYASMPTNAGKYTIKASVNDNNYEPFEITGEFIIAKKEITIENIVATDKAYDGTSTVKVRGTLEGVIYGDEIALELKGRTAGGKVDPGEYDVELTSYVLTGRSKDNYQLLAPLFSAKVKITKKVVMDSASGSYITSSDGFLNSITFSAKEVYIKQNGTNFISVLFGQKAISFSLSVKEYGFEKQLDSPVKFYIKIPDEFLHEKNLKFVVVNGLSHQTIMAEREGDYYTFIADSSGEIIFEVNNFPYWTIILGGVILIILLGLMCMFVLNPMKKRKKIPAQVRNEYVQNQARQKAILKKMKEEQRPKFKKRK